MSRVFGFIKRRPRSVGQVVRFKTAQREAPNPAVAPSVETAVRVAEVENTEVKLAAAPAPTAAAAQPATEFDYVSRKDYGPTNGADYGGQFNAINRESGIRTGDDLDYRTSMRIPKMPDLWRQK